MVVGIIDIDYSAETAASQSERDGPFVSARNDEESRMNEDEDAVRDEKLAHCTDSHRFVKRGPGWAAWSSSCSRNAHAEKLLVRRAHSRIDQATL